MHGIGDGMAITDIAVGTGQSVSETVVSMLIAMIIEAGTVTGELSDQPGMSGVNATSVVSGMSAVSAMIVRNGTEGAGGISRQLLVSRGGSVFAATPFFATW